MGCSAFLNEISAPRSLPPVEDSERIQRLMELGGEDRMKEVISLPIRAVMGPELILPDQRNWADYQRFLEKKRFTPIVSGLTHVPELCPAMFPHQKDVTSWALRLGRAAAFLGTGMGKSLIELEFARVVYEHTKLPVLLLAPLAVAYQMVTEGKKFGIHARYCKDSSEMGDEHIVVTNYERMDNFEPADFSGVVLDESSILKSFDGATRTALIDAFKETPYRLAATATPAPNDHMELGNHAEFLGVMTATEMLSMFFTHDGGETQKWRLKGHARTEFWKWVCSWAVNIRKPSDVGYDDGPFILPPLEYHEHIVDVDTPSEGMLFAMPAETLGERLAARRATVNDRVAEVKEIVEAEPDETWLIWCNLNRESEIIKLAANCVELTGSDSPEDKAAVSLQFAQGEIPRLVSKASILGFGVNYQICSHMIFAGVNDSWEQFFQAVRRCWRFGQTKPVHVHIIAASTEGNVLENLKRKEREANQMADEMVENMQDLTRMNLRGTVRSESTYERAVSKGEDWTMHLADCVELARELPADSIHYSVYSPPFESLYTYSNSERDMGNAKDKGEFWEHYRFLIREQFRALMPGRLISIHCMNLPTSKVRDGHIGIRDFRGEIIRSFEEAGFIYHSEVCIWKDPVTAMQRTKALGLLHKQIRKDSCMSRQGVPDYLVTMRKPGDNPERVGHTPEEFPVQLWQQYASPVWMDINPSDTLQYRSAREHNDERHICPLQLEVIRRAVKLWTNPGDTVWSPFAGIGSEGFVAIEMGRKFIGSELKPSYYRQACKNLERALSATAGLFADPSEDVEEEENCVMELSSRMRA
jgi:DNA modification methylase